jgi:hypothetical protein
MTEPRTVATPWLRPWPGPRHPAAAVPSSPVSVP